MAVAVQVQSKWKGKIALIIHSYKWPERGD